MTVIELQRERLKMYLEAERRVLLNQSYTIGTRTYTMADLEEIRAQINALLAAGVTLDESEKSVGRQKRVVFID